MGDTYTKIIYHVVFSVKYRRSCFPLEIREKVFSLLAHVINEEGVVPLCVGGHVDHIHLLVSIKPTQKISDIISKIKTRSSKLLKLKGLVKWDFEWQNGYGLFTVSSYDYEGLKRYIENQEEHHKKKGFKKEFVKMLNDMDIEYEEKYLFDFLT